MHSKIFYIRYISRSVYNLKYSRRCVEKINQTFKKYCLLQNSYLYCDTVPGFFPNFGMHIPWNKGFEKNSPNQMYSVNKTLTYSD